MRYLFSGAAGDESAAAAEQSSEAAIDWDTDLSRPISAESAGGQAAGMGAPVEISWDCHVSEGERAAAAGGEGAGMDAPVEMSWDFDAAEEEPAEGASEAGAISWDVAPDPSSPAEDAAQGGEEGVSEGIGAADIDWDVQMEGIEVAGTGAAELGGAAIDWDISPEDGADAAVEAPSEEGAVPRMQAAPAAQNAVIAALIANGDFRSRCAAPSSRPHLWGLPTALIYVTRAL